MGTRSSLFNTIDLPVLKPLPLQSYQYTYIKKVLVHIDYHVEVEKHYYSVPYGLIRKRLEAHVTQQMVCIYHQGHCIAQHLKSTRIGGHSAHNEHMPKSHQEYTKWTPERFEDWAASLGDSVLEWVKVQLNNKQHPQQSYRVCLGRMALN